MQLPTFLQGDSPKRLVQGAVGGAVVAIIIGFGWGGWTLGSTAQTMADNNASRAVVAALAPICVEKFKQAAAAPAQLVALKKVQSWERDSFIIKGGWATFPGEAEPNQGVAVACAHALSGAK
jgi:hypothetical protein